jgi:hypothetical protein
VLDLQPQGRDPAQALHAAAAEHVLQLRREVPARELEAAEQGPVGGQQGHMERRPISLATLRSTSGGRDISLQQWHAHVNV